MENRGRRSPLRHERRMCVGGGSPSNPNPNPGDGGRRPSGAGSARASDVTGAAADGGGTCPDPVSAHAVERASSVGAHHRVILRG